MTWASMAPSLRSSRSSFRSPANVNDGLSPLSHSNGGYGSDGLNFALPFPGERLNVKFPKAMRLLREELRIYDEKLLAAEETAKRKRTPMSHDQERKAVKLKVSGLEKKLEEAMRDLSTAEAALSERSTELVTVSTIKERRSIIQRDSEQRHMSGTQTSEESSRSHLILSIVIESTNLQTQALSRGKLSFVDLAGLERVKKSGSAESRLKDA